MKTKLLFLISLLVFTQALKSQTGLQFDGVDDEVDFGVHPGTHLTNNFTVEAAVYLDQLATGWSVIASNFQDSLTYGSGYWLGLNDTSHAVWYLGRHGGSFDGYWLTSPMSLLDSSWHLISGTYGNDTAKLYVDGVLVVAEYVPMAELYSAENFRLGNDVYDEPFNGKLDDVRIWNVLRTSQEIMDNVNVCLTGTETNLMAFYHFETGVGTSQVFDLTSSNIDGVILNADTSVVWVSGLACSPVSNNDPEVLLQNHVRVYPNPSNGVFTIDILNGEKTLGYKVVSSDGKVIRSGINTSNVIHIEMSGEPKGFYVLEIQNGNHVTHMKLVLN